MDEPEKKVENTNDDKPNEQNDQNTFNDNNQEIKNDEFINEEIKEKETPNNNDYLTNNNETEDITNTKNDNKEKFNYEEYKKYNKDPDNQGIFNKIKILFEKYLLSFHNELLKYMPVPYDYLFMFVLGYFFMRLFTGGKSSIYVKKKKKLIDSNVFQIDQKLREISKLQEKLKEKKKNNNNNNLMKIQLPKEEINIDKYNQIENKLNIIKNDLLERNKKDSNERKLQDKICNLQNKILDEVNKKKEEADDKNDEEEEEEEDDEDNQ